MTIQLKPLSVALALVLGTFAASSANAALVSSVVVPFSNSASVEVTEATSGTKILSGVGLGSTELRQFDKSLGVLTGATVNLVSKRTQTTRVQSTSGAKDDKKNGKDDGEDDDKNTYLEHAIASFSSTDELGVLTLDFGSVLQNSTPSQLAFSIFNGSDADRVGLDLDGIIGKGDDSQLYANLAEFNALGAGSQRDFWASLKTSAVGNFLTSYTLKLSDADDGATHSRNKDHSLTLNLKGSVIAANQLPANDVPEPGTMALLALGLVGVATSLRRRKV